MYWPFLQREASLLWVLPDNPFFGHGRTAHDTSITPPPVPTEGHAVQEATYACAFPFPHHLTFGLVIVIMLLD